MTVNVKALINNIGKTYEDLFEVGYIPYKSKPKGDSGSPYLDLDMAKEGVILTFDRESKKLIEVGLTLVREENKKYVFPNELPSPLWPNMYRPEVREKFGNPANSHPPFEVVMMRFGGADHYIMRVGEQRVSMIFTYNLAQMVTHATFQPTERVEWKELDPSLLLK
jgi:hypothetical protein